MSQHCKANPCCGDAPCTGIPLPQHASGLPAHNKNIHMGAAQRTSPADHDKLAVALKGLLAIISDSVGVSGYEPGRVTPWDEFPEVAYALSASPSPVDSRDGLEAARMAHRETLDLLHIRNEKLNAAEQRIERLVKALEEAKFAIFSSDMTIKDRADQACRAALAAKEQQPNG